MFLNLETFLCSTRLWSGFQVQ